jgi:hypothetical protein
MVGMRNDRARARARHLIETYYPAPEDAEVDRLSKLANNYIQEADRLETENSGGSKSEELISSALDAVARDYFAREVSRATPRRKR